MLGVDVPAPSTQLDADGRSVTFAEHVEPETGQVTYTVQGPRLFGAFTIWPNPDSDELYPTAVRVRLGAGPAAAWRATSVLPVVTGIASYGALTADPAQPDRVTHRTFYPYRAETIALCRPLPDRSREYLAAVVRALVRHWAARGDLAELRAAARQQAPARLAQISRHAARLRDTIEPLAATLAECEQQEQALRVLVDEHEAATQDTNVAQQQESA